jgi:hypothetical protein
VTTRAINEATTETITVLSIQVRNGVWVRSSWYLARESSSMPGKSRVEIRVEPLRREAARTSTTGITVNPAQARRIRWVRANRKGFGRVGI